MKPVRRTVVRPQTLDTKKLQKVSGGRGSYCGAYIHCECGYMTSANGGGGDVYGQGYCEACGQTFDGHALPTWDSCGGG